MPGRQRWQCFDSSTFAIVSFHCQVKFGPERGSPTHAHTRATAGHARPQTVKLRSHRPQPAGHSHANVGNAHANVTPTIDNKRLRSVRSYV